MTKSAIQVHTAIAQRAVEIANQDAWVTAHPEIGEPFRVGFGSQAHSITLTWGEEIDHFPQEIIDGLHTVGKSAVKQAIVDNQRDVVGLIVGMARKGDNYFDLFKT